MDNKNDIINKTKDLLVLLYEIGLNFNINSISSDLNNKKKNSKLEMIRIFLNYDL
jgi:hypothetical protein